MQRHRAGGGADLGCRCGAADAGDRVVLKGTQCGEAARVAATSSIRGLSLGREAQSLDWQEQWAPSAL
jgi:hypothetical protein